MKKLSTYLFVIVLSLGATAMLATSGQTVAPVQGSDAEFAADGAFRDGLYLGKLAAGSGQPVHASSGRWATEHDRSAFLAGYSRGYTQSIARADGNAQPSEQRLANAN